MRPSWQATDAGASGSLTTGAPAPPLQARRPQRAGRAWTIVSEPTKGRTHTTVFTPERQGIPRERQLSETASRCYAAFEPENIAGQTLTSLGPP